jgi:hypothetical protein
MPEAAPASKIETESVKEVLAPVKLPEPVRVPTRKVIPALTPSPIPPSHNPETNELVYTAVTNHHSVSEFKNRPKNRKEDWEDKKSTKRPMNKSTLLAQPPSDLVPQILMLHSDNFVTCSIPNPR